MDSLELSQYVIFYCHKNNISITNKKLQKLLYYIQAWSLVKLDKPAFDDPIEAWIHGPVVPKVYREYKEYGYNNIPLKGEDINFKNLEDKAVIDKVLSVYSKFDSYYLETLSHNEKPWLEAREGFEINENCSNEISLQTMKEFFKLFEKQFDGKSV